MNLEGSVSALSTVSHSDFFSSQVQEKKTVRRLSEVKNKAFVSRLHVLKIANPLLCYFVTLFLV